MKTDILPRLFSLGVEIETSPETFGFLRESSDIIDSPAHLGERMAEDGYIFLSGFWERDEVVEVRISILQQLKEMGYLDPDARLEEGKLDPDARLEEGKSVASGKLEKAHPIVFRNQSADAFHRRLQKDPAVDRLLYGNRIMSFFESFLGGRAAHFDFTWVRPKGPGHGSAPHCDIVYMGRGTSELYTAWTPLGDIELKLGGLSILEYSHKKQDVLKRYLTRDVDTYCVNNPVATERKKRWTGALSKDVDKLQKRLGGRWLTAEYRMGDLVIFSMATVHAGLDNQTDRIRLSTDSRYQLASKPIDERWVGESPIGHGAAMKRGRIC